MPIAAERAATFGGLFKPELFAMLHKARKKRVCAVLFDPSIRTIAERIEKFGIGRFDEASGGTVQEGLFADAVALFFTSGTTGEPVGALKTAANIDCEVAVLARLFGAYGPRRVIATVPLIHLYGYLCGVMLPKVLDTTLVLKEEYLPYDLFDLHEGEPTLCVTNPVFVKSMLRLKKHPMLANMVFLSSTGLLLPEECQAFEEKFECRLFQLFGSTETGGIAYKQGGGTLWHPLKGVAAQSYEGVLGVVSDYCSPTLLAPEPGPVAQPFMTTDLIEPAEEEGFRLMGRKSEIIKITGKRLSIVELETLIERTFPRCQVLVRILRRSENLKDEQLEILLENGNAITKEEIQALFKRHYPKINIRFRLKHGERIEKNHLGKKIRRP